MLKKEKRKNVLNGANPNMEEKGLLAPQRPANFLLMVLSCPQKTQQRERSGRERETHTTCYAP